MTRKHLITYLSINLVFLALYIYVAVFCFGIFTYNLNPVTTTIFSAPFLFIVLFDALFLTLKRRSLFSFLSSLITMPTAAVVLLNAFTAPIEVRGSFGHTTFLVAGLALCVLSICLTIYSLVLLIKFKGK